MNVSQWLRVEGTVRANGEDGNAALSGGGSGGSILISANEIDGSGEFQVCFIDPWPSFMALLKSTEHYL